MLFAPMRSSLSASLLGLCLLCACAASNRARQLTADAALPVHVAVLPPAGGDLPPELAACLRAEVGNAFELRGYVKYDDGWVDQRLAQAGLRPWQSDWLPVDESMSAFGRMYGIDGLVFLEDFAVGNINSFVYNERSLTGRFRVLDTRAGRSTWIFDVGSSEAGGALLQSGQIFDAVADSLDDVEVRFRALAGELALAAAEQLPRSASTDAIGRRPEVRGVQGRSDAAAGTVEVVVEGTPDCRAFASLPGSTGRYPLSEAAPGRYVGTLAAPSPPMAVVAVLRDRIGASSKVFTASLAASASGGSR
jgi:hypothetical protein